MGAVIGGCFLFLLHEPSPPLAETSQHILFLLCFPPDPREEVEEGSDDRTASAVGLLVQSLAPVLMVKKKTPLDNFLAIVFR